MRSLSESTNRWLNVPAVRRNLVFLVFFAALSISCGRSLPGDALRDAVSRGHRLGSEDLGVKAVKRLLDAGVPVNSQDGVGWTALMQAGLEGLPAVGELLIRSGADVNLRSRRGETALMVAVSCTIVRTRAELAASRGFPPEMRQAQLGAPLRLASLLLEKGADVNAARQDGRTVLMSAVMVGWPEIVAVLLRDHADVDARDAPGHVAMDYVHPVRDPEIVRMLRSAGSKSVPTRSGRAVCDAQDRLGELGYGVSSEDCWWGWGNATTEALRHFQRDHAISVTGQLDDASVNALGLTRSR
jgi:ankyrin repeat protein